MRTRFTELVIAGRVPAREVIDELVEGSVLMERIMMEDIE